MTLARRIVSECMGTAFLLAVVVGSGIMAERLAGGNVAPLIFCWLYPAVPQNATVVGTVAPSDFAATNDHIHS